MNERSTLCCSSTLLKNNVTVLTENAPGALHGTAVRSHISPPVANGVRQSRAVASEQVILIKGLAQVTNDAGRERALPNAVVRIRRDQDGWHGLSGKSIGADNSSSPVIPGICMSVIRTKQIRRCAGGHHPRRMRPPRRDPGSSLAGARHRLAAFCRYPDVMWRIWWLTAVKYVSVSSG
jgi:hypothetical protein